MKKFIVLCVMLLVIVFSMAACETTGTDQTFKGNMEPKAFGDFLAENLKLHSKLVSISEAEAFELYGIDKSVSEKGAVYISKTGKYPEEVAIFTVEGYDEAKAVGNAMQDRATELTEPFLEKDKKKYDGFEEPLVIQINNCLVMVLSEDRKEAAKVFNKYVAKYEKEIKKNKEN